MRGKIRNILKAATYEIDEAENGIKALQAVASKSYDIIFLDIIMPGMDGLKVLKALTEKKQSPVIVVTADIQESVYKQCIELGAQAVLHKPPKEEELLSMLRKVLGSRKGSEQ